MKLLTSKELCDQMRKQVREHQEAKVANEDQCKTRLFVIPGLIHRMINRSKK